LEGYGTIHCLRKLHQQLNSTLPVLPTAPSGQGYHIPLLDFIWWYLAWSSMQPTTKPLLLKLAFNGATMTSDQQIQQEIGGFQFLHPGKSLSSIKSPDNCHVWVIYLGGETEEELRHELHASIQVKFWLTQNNNY